MIVSRNGSASGMAGRIAIHGTRQRGGVLHGSSGSFAAGQTRGILTAYGTEMLPQG